MKKYKISYTLSLLVFLLSGISLVYSQDDFIPPSNFEYEQSRFQSFYFFLDADIDGNQLDEGDWIGAFNGDVCVGSWPWQGEYTPVPAMGDDDSQWTVGYLLEERFPHLKYTMLLQIFIILQNLQKIIHLKILEHG
jgi:hypothetical protein